MKSKKIGILIVITGPAGSGKDSVMERLLKDPKIQRFHFNKVISYTDRPMRPKEKEGVEHYFVDSKTLDKLASENKFVEPITQTGPSRKATPKSEILRLLNAENIFWRIDPSRGAEVASGKFFTRVFPTAAKNLNSHTLTFFVTAPKEMLEKRRETRDGQIYNKNAYKLRDEDEKPYLDILEKEAVVIHNLDGKLDQAVAKAVRSVLSFDEKIEK